MFLVSFMLIIYYGTSGVGGVLPVAPPVSPGTLTAPLDWPLSFGGFSVLVASEEVQPPPLSIFFSTSSP